jgi:hypothetical protein
MCPCNFCNESPEIEKLKMQLTYNTQHYICSAMFGKEKKIGSPMIGESYSSYGEVTTLVVTNIKLRSVREESNGPALYSSDF